MFSVLLPGLLTATSGLTVTSGSTIVGALTAGAVSATSVATTGTWLATSRRGLGGWCTVCLTPCPAPLAGQAPWLLVKHPLSLDVCCLSRYSPQGL